MSGTSGRRSFRTGDIFCTGSRSPSGGAPRRLRRLDRAGRAPRRLVASDPMRSTPRRLPAVCERGHAAATTVRPGRLELTGEADSCSGANLQSEQYGLGQFSVSRNRRADIPTGAARLDAIRVVRSRRTNTGNRRAPQATTGARHYHRTRNGWHFPRLAQGDIWHPRPGATDTLQVHVRSRRERLRSGRQMERNHVPVHARTAEASSRRVPPAPERSGCSSERESTALRRSLRTASSCCISRLPQDRRRRTCSCCR